MRYKCIEPFIIDKYDENGFCEGNITIPQWTFWEHDDLAVNVLNPMAIHLDMCRKNTKEKTLMWIEVMPDTLATHFEEVQDEQETGEED